METVAPATGAMEITIAEDQPQYIPLRVALYGDNGKLGPRTLLSRWRLSPEERARIAGGEDLYLALITFGQPMQPVILQVGPDGWQTNAAPPSGEPGVETRCPACGCGPLEGTLCIDCGWGG